MILLSALQPRAKILAQSSPATRLISPRPPRRLRSTACRTPRHRIDTLIPYKHTHTPSVIYSPYSLNLRATTRDTRRVRRLNSRTRQPLKLVLAHRRQRILRAPAHGCPLISTHRPRRRRHRAFDRTDLRFHARKISRASRTRAYNPRNTNASGAKLHQTPMRDSCDSCVARVVVVVVVVAARAVQTCAKCMRCDATRGCISSRAACAQCRASTTPNANLNDSR